MKRSDPRAALDDAIARFQAEVERLALAAVRAIVKQELERKQTAERKRPKKKPARSRAPSQVVAEAAPAPAPATTETPSEQPAAQPAGGKKGRQAWTRESIVNELASWMSSGTAIDAPFVARHGPSGLVAAARRIFGRFDAALNVAALQVSKLNPEGPPEGALPIARRAAAAARGT